MLQTAHLGLRVLLELAALAATAFAGFAAFAHPLARLGVGVALPVALAVAWAVFRVPGHGGAPLVAVAPPLRIALEVAVFATAAGLLAWAGQGTLAAALAALALLSTVVEWS